jgi:hypothetical protein
VGLPILALHHSKECAGGLGVIGFLSSTHATNTDRYKLRVVIPAKAGIHRQYQHGFRPSPE